MAHEILPEEDAGIEATSHLWVDLVGIIHEFLEFLGEGDHGFSECRKQPLDQIQILVVLLALNHHSLPLEVIKGHLEVNLLELVDKPLRFLELIQLHYATYLFKIEGNNVQAITLC